ncbi:saccharopine dehydrogenase [Aulographum hederae CBS 113979]|uniref:Saccharopine dehydrogenase [NAD(+), L-lysine-forming] n=1 Tax=Aulographum hederae CBS 113979 TaxID=1176131 RepID=A0A6G1GIV5_9PEZI|nr:saccharopine dehydrogenase [Aulographum hederae CBS 113979]
MAFPTLHLRAEDKTMEHRSALTPSTTASLIRAGYPITVEKSPTTALRKRIFPDSAFADAGATLVPEGSWTTAPEDHVIIGLKELDDRDPFPLKHNHVTFAHCYKGQGGWEKALGRWQRGNGILYDLEFLQDDSGRRVAAFGYHAGYAGAALAIKTWAWQLNHPDGTPLPGVDAYTDGKGYYMSEGEMLEQIRGDVEEAVKKVGRKPRVLVIGALGRCGRGAVDACTGAGCEEILKWDMAETKKGGPFEEIIESDIFSCDTTNPNNPIPVYNINTTFDKPTVPIDCDGPPCTMISIDHLPSLLPAESSEAFSRDLLPSLLELRNRESHPVWKRAEELYRRKVGELP